MGDYKELSRRERQIIDILYQKSEATAQEIHERMEDAPSYSTVRALLVIMEEKGHVNHSKRGRQYLYKPVVEKEDARGSALSHMLSTFFDGSAVEAVATLIDSKSSQLSKDDINRLSDLIKEAAEED